MKNFLIVFLVFTLLFQTLACSGTTKAPADVKNDETSVVIPDDKPDSSDSNIKEDEEGNKKIEAPTVVFVNKGRIVGVYIGVIDSSKEEVISKEEKENLKNNFMSLIDKMLIDDISTTKISEE